MKRINQGVVFKKLFFFQKVAKNININKKLNTP